MQFLNKHFRAFGLALAIILFLVPTQLFAGSITAEFNDPPNPDGVKKQLLEIIGGANKSLDIAIYSLRSQVVINHLIDAKEAGVEVRIVTEKDNRTKGGYYNTGSKPYFDQLVEAGIEVKVDDRSSALMHEKFIVADNEKVLTGSMNFTESQMNGDKNNIIRFNSDKIAHAFSEEFEEMWTGRFGASKNNDPVQSFTVDGARVVVLFSPGAEVREAVGNHLNTAENSVYFNTFAFTDDGLANRLDSLHNSGLIVRGTMDAWKAVDGNYNQFSNLKNEGVPVSKDSYNGILHDKYIVVDGNSPASEPRVLTGSYNYTTSADESNDENMVIILDKEIAGDYYADAVNTYQNHSKNPADPIISTKININTADQSALETLDGIGPVTAQNIIDNRIAEEPFTTKEELTRVDGIGPATVDNIQAYITAGEVSPRKININTASKSTLDQLEGIGPATAQNILSYRETNGNFTSIEAIKNVSGIGPATYENIKSEITVSETSGGSGELININTANQTKLEKLDRTGPVTAQKIISYRKNNGEFESKEAIKNVDGIGPVTYESIKTAITVSSTSDPVNINMADKTRLKSLNGIGPATAENIISYRNSFGSFTQKTELKNVNGIGDATYSSLEDKITVE